MYLTDKRICPFIIFDACISAVPVKRTCVTPAKPPLWLVVTVGQRAKDYCGEEVKGRTLKANHIDVVAGAIRHWIGEYH